MASPSQPEPDAMRSAAAGQAGAAPKPAPFWPLWVVGALGLLMALTLGLRLWALNATPPGLWWDEATQGTDAWSLLHGQFRVFFPSAEGKEPLYVYLTAPFVAVWNGQPFAVRMAGALLGVLMVPALYVTARSLWRQHPQAGIWAGLAAAGLWAVNYWPQSINRIGFQVNAFPIVMTLSVATWVNWAFGRPTRRRAFVFGLLAGLTLATYLAARFTPALWVVLFLVLPAERRRRLRPDIGWALLGFAVTAVPLALHFLLHWQDFTSRTGVFPLLNGEYAGRALLDALWFNARKIAGAFLGWAGDPVLRHNIPDRPPFSPVTAGLVALGLGAALVHLRRRNDPRGWTLLAWLAMLSLPGLLSLASNPHFPRLFGALPAALLLAAWPVASLAGALKGRAVWLRAAAIAGLVILLAAEGVRTVQAYFVTWRQMDLYEAFQLDFASLVETIRTAPDGTAVVPVTEDSGAILDYQLRNTPALQVQVDDATIESWLTQHLPTAGNQRILAPVWNQGPQVAADPARIVPFYLGREGILESEDLRRYYDVRTYQLGDQPVFDAAGQRTSLSVPFSPEVSLIGARWGAAYPNADRNGDTAAAGTRFWAILDWQVNQPPATLRASVDIVDNAGHRLNTSDEHLLPAESLPDLWVPGSIVRTRHLVEVPATQVPATVTLQTRLYDSETLVPLRPPQETAEGGVIIGEARVSQPLSSATFAPVRPAQAMQAVFPGEVKLLGADTWAQEVAPGLPLTLRLYWQATASPTADQTAFLSLGDTGVSTAIQLPAGIPAGFPFHTTADLALPPDLQPGVYPLMLRSETAGAPAVQLGAVTVQGRPHEFEPPSPLMPWPATFRDPEADEHSAAPVQLLGMLPEIDQTEPPGQLLVTPGQAITLTLVWQAGATPDADLVRFVHLIGSEEGPPRAQNDGVLCAAACPARSWLPGEIFLDRVQLVVPPDLEPGVYRLSTGWYDATTFKRLTATDGTEPDQPNDHILLPYEIVVAPGGTPPHSS